MYVFITCHIYCLLTSCIEQIASLTHVALETVVFDHFHRLTIIAIIDFVVFIIYSCVHFSKNSLKLL